MKKEKMFKKIISLGMALGICATFTCASAFADTVDQTSEGSASTEWTYEYKNDPTYTVTIPSAVTMSKDGATVEIKAENVANLESNQKVSVTIAGTDAYRNQMVLSGKTATGGNASMRYQFVMKDASVIETTGGKDQVNGVELASFTEDGSEKFMARPVATGSASKKGVMYSGSMTYGISLVDVQ